MLLFFVRNEKRQMNMTEEYDATMLDALQSFVDSQSEELDNAENGSMLSVFNLLDDLRAVVGELLHSEHNPKAKDEVMNGLIVAMYHIANGYILGYH